jgi:hypothetical protein
MKHRVLCKTAMAAIAVAVSARADLGLKGIIESQNVRAAVPVLQAAAQAAHKSGDVRNELLAILNEAAQTGNEDAVRYAIVAVMVAGGEGNMDAALAAINASQAFSDFPGLTASTVAETQAIMADPDSSPDPKSPADPTPDLPTGSTDDNPFGPEAPGGLIDGDIDVTPT